MEQIEMRATRSEKDDTWIVEIRVYFSHESILVAKKKPWTFIGWMPPNLAAYIILQTFLRDHFVANALTEKFHADKLDGATSKQVTFNDVEVIFWAAYAARQRRKDSKGECE